MDLKSSIRYLDIFNPLTYYIALVYFITRLLENLLDSKNFWTKVWNTIIDINDDEHIFKIYGTLIYMTLLYWAIGSLFIIMDVTNKPEFFRKYKTQPETHVPLDMKKFLPALRVVLINNQVIGSVVMYLLCTAENKIISTVPIRTTTSFQRLMIDIVIYQFLYELCFYYAHRLFHHRHFYKWHKKHHEWTAPVAVMATYAHPVEHLVANLLPVIIPISLLQAPLSTSWILMTITTISTLGDHSGYHLPFLHSPRMHDAHHQFFNECYGAMGLMDRLHSTSVKFERSINSKRHMTLFTLASANELHPDEPKPAAQEINNNEKQHVKLA